MKVKGWMVENLTEAEKGRLSTYILLGITKVGNALFFEGYETVGELIKANESSLLSVKGIGKAGINKINEALSDWGLKPLGTTEKLRLIREIISEPDHSGNLSEGQNYTPGPWTVGYPPHGHCRIYSRTEVHAIARTYGNELNGIGVCDLTGPKNAADAVLISAAPELLEALIRMVNIYDAMNGPRCPSRIIADAAIAKATGDECDTAEGGTS